MANWENIAESEKYSYAAVLGRAVWTCLHTYCYDDVPPKQYLDLARSLLQNYPCKECRENSEGIVSKALAQLEEIVRQRQDEGRRDRMALWAARLHASVNKLNNKNPNVPILRFESEPLKSQAYVYAQITTWKDLLQSGDDSHAARFLEYVYNKSSSVRHFVDIDKDVLEYSIAEISRLAAQLVKKKEQELPSTRTETQTSEQQRSTPEPPPTTNSPQKSGAVPPPPPPQKSGAVPPPPPPPQKNNDQLLIDAKTLQAMGYKEDSPLKKPPPPKSTPVEAKSSKDTDWMNGVLSDEFRNKPNAAMQLELWKKNLSTTQYLHFFITTEDGKKIEMVTAWDDTAKTWTLEPLQPEDVRIEVKETSQLLLNALKNTRPALDIEIANEGIVFEIVDILITPGQDIRNDQKPKDTFQNNIETMAIWKRELATLKFISLYLPEVAEYSDDQNFKDFQETCQIIRGWFERYQAVKLFPRAVANELNRRYTSILDVGKLLQGSQKTASARIRVGNESRDIITHFIVTRAKQDIAHKAEYDNFIAKITTNLGLIQESRNRCKKAVDHCLEIAIGIIAAGGSEGFKYQQYKAVRLEQLRELKVVKAIKELFDSDLFPQSKPIGGRNGEGVYEPPYTSVTLDDHTRKTGENELTYMLRMVQTTCETFAETKNIYGEDIFTRFQKAAVWQQAQKSETLA